MIWGVLTETFSLDLQGPLGVRESDYKTVVDLFDIMLCDPRIGHRLARKSSKPA
jgi:hypothetical protein